MIFNEISFSVQLTKNENRHFGVCFRFWLWNAILIILLLGYVTDERGSLGELTDRVQWTKQGGWGEAVTGSSANASEDERPCYKWWGSLVQVQHKEPCYTNKIDALASILLLKWIFWIEKCKVKDTLYHRCLL